MRLRVLLIVLLLGACSRTPPIISTPSLPPGAAGTGGSGGTNAPEHLDKPHIVLVSFDGVRHDYLDRFTLPNFRRMMNEGARAEALIPIFPSKTFPNHYSIVTGMYADSHGLVGNSMYDPDRRDTYAMWKDETVQDGTWYRGEPIWVTAEKQGMVAACYFWPGSEAAIGGVRPTFFTHYSGGVPDHVRVDALLEWLRLPAETRPHVLTLYFADVDSAGHRHGPATPGVGNAMRKMDTALGRLLNGIAALPIRDRVFVVVVSDHGMAPTPRDRMVPFPSIDMRGVVLVESGPVANLHVTGGRGRIVPMRDALNRKLSHGRAYLRSELPERLHYGADPRAGDIVIVMEETYLLMRPGQTPPASRGNHGWDPAVPSMHGIFLVSGPGIPAAARIPKFENIDIYPFMAELLGLRPAAGIDGVPGRLRELIGMEQPEAVTLIP